jgi:hypothetical protein
MAEEIHFNHIVSDTVSGLDLRIREIQVIENIIKFKENEKIEILFMFGGGFEKHFDINMKNIVGITNERIFKLENGIVKYAMFNEINKVNHIKKNIFRWDQIVCEMKNGKNIEFGIYHRDTAKHFTNYLKMKLGQLY